MKTLNPERTHTKMIKHLVLLLLALLLPSCKNAGDADEFQILSAQYGGEGKWVDVTRKVRARVNDNVLGARREWNS